jgi:hypothetical protein
MTDELQLRFEAERGMRAKALMENELLVEAFDAWSRLYIEAWRTSAPAATDQRERAWMALAALDSVRADLRRLLDGGKIAQAELDRDARLNAQKGD